MPFKHYATSIVYINHVGWFCFLHLRNVAFLGTFVSRLSDIFPDDDDKGIFTAEINNILDILDAEVVLITACIYEPSPHPGLPRMNVCLTQIRTLNPVKLKLNTVWKTSKTPYTPSCGLSSISPIR